MKTRKYLCLLLVLATVLLLLTGCGANQAKDEENRISISMHLWDRSMLRDLTPWLEAKFPEIDFTFTQVYNTMDYFKDIIARGDELADIITCRRFSLNDAASLSAYLMDLSQTEVANTFYSSYLEINRETSGAIRWLPMCAEVDSTLANKALFDRYSIPLPTNYAEFLAAIDAFEAVGIKGYQTDWAYDYTCLETMQGCATPELMSLEGTQWRMKYESATDTARVGLDDVVWPKVFAKYEQFLKDVRFQPGDEKLNYSPATDPFLEGRTAMMRGTAAMADQVRTSRGMDLVMLPYFGETEQENWLLTYPMCQVAVSKKVTENKEKQAAVMKVMEAICSQEGQEKMASGTSVLSYSKQVKISPTDSMQYVQDCIERNHLYMRLASTEIFTISQDVAHKMMTGEYDAQAAYDAFNAQLTRAVEPKTAEVLFTQKTAYANAMTEHGNPAASSLLNTMRSAYGEQIAIGYSHLCSAPIYAGDYTAQQAKWVMTIKSLISSGEYTGAEIRQLMDWLVNVKEDGANPIRHRNLAPVTSGMEYTVTEYERGKFRLEDITVDGKPLDDKATYTVMLLGAPSVIWDAEFCNCPLPEHLKEKYRAYQVKAYNANDCLLKGLSENQQFLAPSSYVTIRRGK
ncbi:MAG: extracellular solute-binding protein [Aristaeellaceae bacterium]